MASDLSEMPGPEVLVTPSAPPYDAPAGYSTTAAGEPLLGALRVNVGHPSKFAFKAAGRAIGETFEASLSTDGYTEIFISPFIDEPADVLGTLIHEMGHATVGVKQGHNEHFVKFMKAVNLIGKPTATRSGRALQAQLKAIATELGPYPRKKLDVTKLPEPQTGRLLKLHLHRAILPIPG